MKIFVTVGHTRFDSLFRALDRIAEQNPQLEFICQISDGKYKPEHMVYFSYDPAIERHYKNADLVITHAGAGTVYKLLEMGQHILVVNNTDRIDPHQNDLIRFVEENGYGLVCRELSCLESGLSLAKSFRPNRYKKEPFFMAEEINAFLQLPDENNG